MLITNTTTEKPILSIDLVKGVPGMSHDYRIRAFVEGRGVAQ